MNFHPRCAPEPRRLAGLSLLLALGAQAATAPDEAATRDPMQWPSAMRAAAAAASAPEAAGPTAPARALLIQQDRTYVLHGGRRLERGDKLGDAQITRIEAQAIWLKQDGQLRREPLYPGVELQPLAPAEATRKPQRRRPAPSSAPRPAAPASEVQR